MVQYTFVAFLVVLPPFPRAAIKVSSTVLCIPTPRYERKRIPEAAEETAEAVEAGEQGEETAEADPTSEQGEKEDEDAEDGEGGEV